jgi:hypothetical protein
MFNGNWKCLKCNKWIGDNIDRDYHDNTAHPDFSNPYVAAWYRNGCKGMSPYD